MSSVYTAVRPRCWLPVTCFRKFSPLIAQPVGSRLPVVLRRMRPLRAAVRRKPSGEKSTVW